MSKMRQGELLRARKKSSNANDVPEVKPGMGSTTPRELADVVEDRKEKKLKREANIEEMLASTEPIVSPQELLEVVTEQLEKQLPASLNGDSPIKTAARQRVLSFMVGLELKSKSDLQNHISRALSEKLRGRWKENNPEDSSERVAQMAEKHSHFIDETEEDFIDDIDQPVAPGGMTRLHVAAMDGEGDEVKKLLANGARTDILDNQGWTAEKRALATGHRDIAEMLKGHSQYEETKE